MSIFTTYEKIALVRNKENQVFIADPTKLSQLETACRWAYPNICWLYDWTIENVLTCEHYDIEVVDNEGFTLTIVDAAANAWSGGKLSFWTCYVEKENVRPFTVGINSMVLCELILHSTMLNGKCTIPVKFIRKDNQVGAIHEGMPSWNESIAYIESKKTHKATKKTSKWIPGHVYSTPTKKTYYLGQYIDNFSILDTGHAQISIYIKDKMQHYCIEDFYFGRSPEKVGIDCNDSIPSRVDDGECEITFDKNAIVKARCVEFVKEFKKFIDGNQSRRWVYLLNRMINVYGLNPELVKSTLIETRDTYGDVKITATFSTGKYVDRTYKHIKYDYNLKSTIDDILEMLK